MKQQEDGENRRWAVAVGVGLSVGAKGGRGGGSNTRSLTVGRQFWEVVQMRALTCDSAVLTSAAQCDPEDWV